MGGWIRTLTGLATLAVMFFGGWYVLNLWQTGNREGGEVRLILRFAEAHGVPVGGAVRHKGVAVGEVLDVDVSPDDSGVILEVGIAGKFKHTLRKKTCFWIVRPHFGGLTQGVSGLDTLIKDPYVEYDTSDLGAPPLTSGTVVFGMNQPPTVDESRVFPHASDRRSSVTFKVRFANAKGLREGAPVLYRDLPVGTVRGVDLSLDGRAVEVEVLLHGRYQETARTDSVFWIATPNIEFGWPNFFNVRDMSKILTGAALSYATPTLSLGRPIKNNDIMEGSTTPPSDKDLFEGPLVSIDPAEGKPWSENRSHGLCLAGVSYAFVEEDLFQDHSEFYQGTALLFKDPQGRTLALTARTLGDGTYSCSDFLSSPDIEGENLAVRLEDESVHEAHLLWTDPEGRDLAVLAFEGEAPEMTGKEPRFSDRKSEDEYYLLLAFREDLPGGIHTQPLPA
ncbi:MAG: MCE family protein, partial [Planctomycetes bacterium]|nr:MCE family protein [Planctomycetota bacterium]